MTRKARLHIPGAIYHVTLRGNHRLPIFFEHSDTTRFAELVAEYTAKHAMVIHAYCWMPNHVHLAIEVADVPLGPALRSIASRYSRAIQRRRQTSGHLFERRFHAVLVDCRRYLYTLVKYIHLNPVRAGITTDPAAYEWSGHRAYLGMAAIDWLETRRVLSYLHPQVAVARALYTSLMQTELSPDELALLRTGPADGDQSRPVLPAFARSHMPASAAAREIQDTIQDVCATFGLAAGDLLSTARNQPARVARALIAWRLSRRGIVSLRLLAPLLGRGCSTIAETLVAVRKQHPALFAEPAVPVSPAVTEQSRVTGTVGPTTEQSRMTGTVEHR